MTTALLHQNLIDRVFRNNVLLHSAYCLYVGRIISAKNGQAWVSMHFILNKYLAPVAIEKIKILGAL